MKREILKTADGSTTIYLPEMDESYHSTHGAIQEAEHIFIQNGLLQHEEKGFTSISIFEMGFGTGLNALLTAIRSNSLIQYIGIEAFPVEPELLSELNYLSLIGEGHRQLFDAINSAQWEEEVPINESFQLKKIEAKIEDFEMPINSFDLIYFDAFGPRAQAEMWTPQVLEKMSNSLKVGGALVTYCAMGQFKRDLKALGLTIEVLPGPPGKREMTKAWKV
jgi:tRNA U34 5-methylaminomethyl-2-thiouridine-forming methyltransferase MnmC